MKTLHVLTATAGILLALAGPTLAAQRAHRAYDAYASDRSGAYNYGPVEGSQARTPAQAQYDRTPTNYGQQNLPYPDRPYGDPDRW